MSSIEPQRIDVHAHALTPAYRNALQDAGIHLIGGIPVPDWSPAVALQFMDAHGIATQMLSISDPGADFLAAEPATALARTVNDELAAMVSEHPQRFGGFAVLSLQDVDGARAEAIRALDELGLDGVALLSSTGGRYLGDPVFEPLLAELDARNAWVFVHPTAVAADARPEYAIPSFVAEYPFDTTRTIISLLFNGTFDRHPGIRWHLAHGGGTVPMLRKRLDTLATYAPLAADVLGLPPGSKALTPDSCDRALRAAFFDTALVADRPALLALDAMCGKRGIVFGSDWPFAALMYSEDPDPQPALGGVFSAADRAQIDHRNAREAFPRLGA